MKAYWTTKSGDKIEVKNMTNRHLENAIAFLRKQVERVRDYSVCHVLEVGNTISDEMASISLDSELEKLATEPIENLAPHIYHVMLKEKKRRENG
jgi:hypothetical protein